MNCNWQLGLLLRGLALCWHIPSQVPRMQVFLLQLALVPYIPDVTRALFIARSWVPPGKHCNSMPHFEFALFLEEGLQNFCKILRCPWSRKFQNCLVCCPNLQGPLSSCAVSYSPAQAWECKQPKKLASPFIPRVFFLTFVFIFESDAYYSKLLKGVRTFPPRRKWNWYAK